MEGFSLTVKHLDEHNLGFLPLTCRLSRARLVISDLFENILFAREA